MDRAGVVRLRQSVSIPSNSEAGFGIPFDYSLAQGKAILAETPEVATLFDLHTGNRMATWRNNTSAYVASCALIGNKPKAAVGLFDGTLVIWASDTPLLPDYGINDPPLQPLFASASDVSLAAPSTFEMICYDGR